MIYSNFSKSIWSLALINLINGIGSFIYPFIALFLTVKLDYSASEAGFFVLISTLMYAPGSIFSSHFADKTSRKKVMIISQLLCGVSMILCGLAISNRKLVLIFILLISLFDGATDPARQAIYADHTNLNNRKEAFSLFYLANNIGFAIGPLIAGLLFNNYPNWLFLGNGIISILAISMIAILIEDKKPTEAELKKSLESNQKDKAVKGSILKVIKEKPILTSYLIITSFFGLAISMYFFTMPLFMTYLFDSNGPSFFGTIMSVNAITVIVFTPILIKLSGDKYPLKLITYAMILYSISYFLMGISNTLFIILILTVLFSIGEVFHATNHDFFITNHTPLGHRARLSSIQTIVQGIGFSVGPLISGLIIDYFGYSAIFISSSTIIFICLILLQVVRHQYLIKDGTKY